MTSYKGIEFLAGGAVTGASLPITIGNLGLVGGFGGVSLGMGVMTGVGAITGTAVYGALKAIDEGDATAIGAIGLGTLGGIGTSATIGGMGLGIGGGAIGIGMGSMAVAGGIVGLGIYGLANLFIQADTEKKYYRNLYFLEEITREYEEEKVWAALEGEPDIDAELERLKQEMADGKNWAAFKGLDPVIEADLERLKREISP